jgi:hypothetical protein
MPKYAVLIYEREDYYADMAPEAYQTMMDAHQAFAKAVVEHGGTILGGEALQPTGVSTSIRGGAVTDGPFAETKEALGGFYLLEARDLDHAIELGKLTPAPAGGVEVRPLMEFNQA